MDRDAWNERYSGKELVWGAGPNRFVAEAFAEAPARGRALDLACGEGRNAVALAAWGWQVTAVDFSPVALARGQRLADERGVEVTWVEADLGAGLPPGAFELVLLSYVHLPPQPWAQLLARAAAALAPGGELFGVGHARRNAAEGTGGPPRLDVLWDPAQVEQALRAAGLRVERAQEVLRPVEGAPRPAIDAIVRARRGGAAG